MRSALSAIRTRWLSIFASTLVAVLVAGFIVWQSPARYAATTDILIVSIGDGASTSPHVVPPERAESYAHILQSLTLAERAAERAGGQVDAEQLHRNTHARVINGTDLLQVRVYAESSAEAQRLAHQMAFQFTVYLGELESPRNNGEPAFEAHIAVPAVAASNPEWKSAAIMVALAALIGLVIGALIAIVRESRDHTVKGPTDLRATLDTSVLGAIALDRTAQEAPLVTGLDRQHPRVESYRILRTNLQFTGVDHGSRVIVVSSAVAGEGKSTTAANLAIVMAQAGQRVAVVEGDLRRPKIAEYLGVPNDVGVTTTLIGRVDLDGALQPARTPGLEVLASGRRPPNPAELVQTQAMRDLIESLRERFDVVLIDTPPLLPVTDAAVLSRIADGVLLVVQHGKTRHEELKTAIERLDAVQARLLGVVLNMAPAKPRAAYASGYAYGYGYEYAADYDQQKRGGARRA